MTYLAPGPEGQGIGSWRQVHRLGATNEAPAKSPKSNATRLAVLDNGFAWHFGEMSGGGGFHREHRAGRFANQMFGDAPHQQPF